MRILTIVLLICLGPFLWSQNRTNPFQSFDGEWPTPNECRLGSGAPGPGYWQQRADYRMDISLDPTQRLLTGEATITYFNQSPHTLDYLWLQLDQDIRRPQSIASQLVPVRSMSSPSDLYRAEQRNNPFEGGYDLGEVLDASGKVLSIFRGETNLRIDLESPLAPGDSFVFSLSWSYAINDATVEGRSGFEYFPEDNTHVFEIAQFFPRMCAYDDVNGWQNRPFYGSAEFALEFGNYDVAVSVPEPFVVAGTGELVNAEEVLGKNQLKRWEKMKRGNGDISFIITPEEARKNASRKIKGEKTWRFQAENVRDFAFAASRKFVWDAAQISIGDRPVIAQSLYPPEGMPLWDKYATHTVIHTLKTYSKYSVDYPYPQATAIHGPVWGMEYPMICFCGGRPSNTGYYSRTTKYRMIGVVMHEVGHNFFPMIVNSDERAWAWMDEGLNSFLEYLTEATWEPNFPHRRGPADTYVVSAFFGEQDPIMTNVECIRENGLISYGKTAAGLNILREVVMGPEAFDDAFRTYARRWAFRRPKPADFFRTMEDASGMDLEWFWRGWFYGTGDIDYGITEVRHYAVETTPGLKTLRQTYPEYTPSAPTEFYIDGKPSLEDKYTYQVEATGRERGNEKIIGELLAESGDDQEGRHIYQITVARKGAVVVPLVVDAVYADGSRSSHRLPAQIWFGNREDFTYEYRSDRRVVAFYLDGQRLLPDMNRADNLFPNPGKARVFEEVDWQ